MMVISQKSKKKRQQKEKQKTMNEPKIDCAD